VTRRPLLLLIPALASLSLVTACASKRIRRENAAALVAADARVIEGCYDCLLDARATYEQLAASKYANQDIISLRLFETNLLLLLREKELGLDWRASTQRAKALAARVPSSVDAARVLAIAGAVLPDRTGRAPDWPVQMRRDLSGFVPKIPGEIAWLATAPLRPVVRDYLALALDCSYDGHVLAPNKQPGAAQRRPVLPPDSPPAIIYQTGICMGAESAMLAAALALVPRFHEATYFAGTLAAFGAEDDGGAKAAPLLAQAHERFPRSPGINYMRGWLAKEVGECTEAVGHFDAALSADSTHEFALLERTICLSRLHHDTAAIASATLLLALNSMTMQPAYYWRAVSQLRLKDLPAARSDIEAAKALARDANALTLAGMIENEQNDLAIAEQDLRAARALLRGEENCTAAWTLALVIGKGARPAEAAQMFEAAMGCYDIKVADARYFIARLRNKPTSNAAYLAKRIAALEADSTDQRTRYYAAAFNGAGHTANAGRLERALELLAVAAQDPKLAAPVAEMRKAIIALR
jgi:tetratricopeptide (TPR) repeat protein